MTRLLWNIWYALYQTYGDTYDSYAYDGGNSIRVRTKEGKTYEITVKEL